MQDLNLSRRPFVNVRPVKRVSLVLTVLGMALLTMNALLFWRHFSGEGKTRSRSQELARAVSSEEEAIAQLQQEIVGLDIDALNRRARFVNGEIDRRRFGWSRLFDRIAEVQPGDVRLVSLIPSFSEERRGRRQREEVTAPSEVNLSLRGVSKSGEAILEFIDALFGHPAFREPDISRESTRQDGQIDFVLSVLYLPDLQHDGDGPVPPDGSEGSAERERQEASGESLAGEAG